MTYSRRHKLSLKTRILNYLRNNQKWIHKGRIEDLAKEAGYLGETSGRVCRSLERAGFIEVRQVRGSDEYKAAPPQKVDHYIIKGEAGRPDKKLEVPVYE